MQKATDFMSATARRCFCSAFLLAIASCSWHPFRPTAPTAEKILARAIATAKKDHKLVLLVFGFHDNGWSDRLDQFHAEPEVVAVLQKHFVITRVDMDETPGGMEMYLQRGPRGAPAFSIFDSSGQFLVDSGQDEQNFGFPNDDEQVDRYIAALTTACPKLSEDDTAVLRSKLEQMRIPRQE